MDEIQSNSRTNQIFAHRLMFTVRYSQMHETRLERDYPNAALDLLALLRDEIAPRSWWPILLCDAVEFMQYGMLKLISM